MTAAVIVWLLQDLAQVLAMGFMLVPELFLIVVVYKILSGPQTGWHASLWLWLALVGGMLWDLRWASSPGMSAIVNVLCASAVYLFWTRIPAGGRGWMLFSILACAAHLVSGIAHYLAWAVPSQAAVRMFFVQQLLSIPLLAIVTVVFVLRSRGSEL